MPQVLKDDMRARILEAAGATFAEQGFQAARLADIAARAGTSASNIYKYATDKAGLFGLVVPPSLVEKHRRLLDFRIDEFERRNDWRNMDAQASGTAHALLEFWAAHRHAVAILMSRAAGTPYESVRGEMIARALSGSRQAQDSQLRFVLEQVFTRTLDTLSAILLRYETAQDIREAVSHFWRFQLSGLDALLQERHS